MTDDKFDPDESHFSDEELEAALAGFEKEFADDSVSGDASDTSDADKTADAASAKSDSDANDDTADKASADSGRPMTDDVTGSVADAVNEAMADVVDPSLGFDNELAGLLGNKAKVALIVTRLASAELLAAFCQLSDISAACIGANQGAVAVLKNLDGEGPDHRGIRHGRDSCSQSCRQARSGHVRAGRGRPEFRAARAVHLHTALRRGPDARHRNPEPTQDPRVRSGGFRWTRP